MTFYTRTAEMVAVLLPQAWTGLGPALTTALDGLDPADGPVVDVGAGTGEGVRVAAAGLPGVEIVAVEPDPALRTALLAVVAADPDLRGRVTVVPTDLAGTRLPDRIGAVLLMNVLGHLAAAERRELWELVAARLAPRGRVVLTLYPPTSPQHVPESAMAEATLGRRRYVGSASAEPAGDDLLRWRMRYRVVEGDTCVDALDADSLWHTVDPVRIADELRPHGLTITESDPEQFVHVIRRDDVDRHYGLPARGDAILAAVEAAGHDPERFDHRVLEGVEEFHSMGRRGTVALAERAGIAAGDAVLDVGCGIGGPARYLTGTLGARVTGVDLTRAFCTIARDLNRRTGFGESIDIRHADALALPFDDASFDVVWFQHVAVNVADTGALFRELRRVLRTGGRLAFVDPVRGDGEEPVLPVVWAAGPELNHLVEQDEMRSHMDAAGFTVRSFEDLHDELAAAHAAGGPRPAPGPELLVDDYATKSANTGRNLREGRIRLVRGVAVAR